MSDDRCAVCGRTMRRSAAARLRDRRIRLQRQLGSPDHQCATTLGPSNDDSPEVQIEIRAADWVARYSLGEIIVNMTDNLTTAEILDCAADYLRVHGWRRGTYNWKTLLGGPDEPDGSGPCCVVGAIHRADESSRLSDSERGAAASALAEVICAGCPLNGVAGWNDQPGRTADEAIDALMEAAARSREESK